MPRGKYPRVVFTPAHGRVQVVLKTAALRQLQKRAEKSKLTMTKVASLILEKELLMVKPEEKI